MAASQWCYGMHKYRECHSNQATKSCCRWRQSIRGFDPIILVDDDALITYYDYMAQIPLLTLSQQGPNHILIGIDDNNTILQVIHINMWVARSGHHSVMQC